jgi:cyanophycin synthetase
MENGIEIVAIRRVWPRNRWHPADVLVVDLRVDCPAAPAAAAVEAIDEVLPARRGLVATGPAATPAAGDAPADAAAAWARLLAEVTLVLQSHARSPAVGFHRVDRTADPRVLRLVIEARDHQLAEECLARARELLVAARAGGPLDVQELLPDLVDHADDVCLGPSTLLMVHAAEARGIPWLRISDDWSLVQFGQGARQRRIWTAETDRTSAIGETISRNKELTKRVLEAAGVPVPRGRVVTTAEEAWEAAQAVGLPVVVKPLDANHGRGVFLNLTTREEVEAAFPVARKSARSRSAVIVEQLIPGVEHRLLVVGPRMVACAQGEYIYVTGDGASSVAALIDAQINSDARRGPSAGMPNKTVYVDDWTVVAQLAQEGVTPESVPAAGRRVLVKKIGTHGADVTANVHPDFAVAAVRAARAVGLDVAGIDLVAQDITRPMLEQGAMICEVNAGPQLLVHTMPSSGSGQPVGELIVAELFPPGHSGRIPVVAVLGAAVLGATGDGAAAVARLVDAGLRAAGRVPGLACGQGKWVGGWKCDGRRHVGVAECRDLLMAPDVDAAVVELEPADVLASGLPFDRIDALVLAPGSAESADMIAAAEVLARIVPTDGTIVVPADRRVRRRGEGRGRGRRGGRSQGGRTPRRHPGRRLTLPLARWPRGGAGPAVDRMHQ